LNLTAVLTGALTGALTGRAPTWLNYLARSFWVLIAGSSIGLSLYFLPQSFAFAQTVCPPVGCDGDLGNLTVESAALLGRWQITPARFAVITTGISLLIALVFCAVGLLIFLRAQGRIAYFLSLALVLYGTLPLGAGAEPQNAAVFFLYSTYNYLLFVSLVLGFYLFPNGRFVPAWSRWIALALFVTEFFYSYFPDAPFSPHNIFPPLELAIWVGALALIPLAQIYRYWRVSSRVERQQTKWVVAGLTLVLLGVTLLYAANALLPPPSSLLIEPFTLALLNLTFVFIPITLAIAMLRYRLFDIDILLRRTLLYSLLTLALAVVYFGSVIVLQRVFGSITDQESQLAVAISTLGIALLFLPLRRKLQGSIDRRFYRRKYDAEQALGSFAARCRDETEVEALVEELRLVLQQTMQPAGVSVWLKSREDDRM